jgi:LruC domain-containing protein
MKTQSNKLTRTVLQSVLILILSFSILYLQSCKKDPDSGTPQDPVIENMDDLVVSPSFDYRTDKNVNIRIGVFDNTDAPVKDVRLDIYTAHPDSGGAIMLSGLTSVNGYFEAVHTIPAYYQKLYVGTRFIGLPNMQEVDVLNGNLDFKLGGTQKKSSGGAFRMPKSTNANIVYMGTFNSNGVPSYLEPVNDVISSSFLSDINATLPEYQPVPTYHPTYLATSNETDLIIDQASDVWVTFVHEGAGYKNVLGFYTYNLSSPPTSAAQISEIKIIFPNFSFSGSGGGLFSGNRVKIGTFPANTGIGWVLIADAFKNGTVGAGIWTFYSNPDFNPEPTAAKRQHNVVLSDPGRDIVLIGFEDQRRDGSCDNDFNDAIFYVKANPITAIQTANYPVITYTATDTDNDGVSNTFDDYPTDPTKAFNNYFPSSTGFSSLAFEDLWPAKGDFDVNDMVVDYRINQITNAANKVVKVECKYVLRAIGASYNNGFGVQLGVDASKISSVTGIDLSENFIELDSKNLETGQNKATFIAFDNAYHILPFPGGPYVGVNTSQGAPFVTPDTLNIAINLVNPVMSTELGLPPYNPFMIVNKIRGKEVHLPDFPPTQKADLSLLGTSDDDSNPSTGRYYKTKNNLPFALHITEKFDYPVEKSPIIAGHLKFANWAQASGTNFSDWFRNLTGYRNNNKIFTH